MGSFIFVFLIDNFRTAFATINFIDDVTTTEVMTKPDERDIEMAADQLAIWSAQNSMVVNTKKTKMLLGSAVAHTMPCISFNNNGIERINSFKLLGVTINLQLMYKKNLSV